jgi:serralysin
MSMLRLGGAVGLSVFGFGAVTAAALHALSGSSAQLTNVSAAPELSATEAKRRVDADLASRGFDMGPVIACFDPASPPTQEWQDRLNELYMAFDPRYNVGSRWSGAIGSPRALTWSFAPDGLSIPSGIGEGAANNTLFATMDARFAARGGRATWVTQFVNSFARWQALSGVSYTRITVGGNDWDDGAAWGTAGSATLRGDVRISMKPIDGLNGVLAYNSFPSNGDMVLDSGDGTSFANTTNTYRFLRNTVMHEHGHGLGFSHVCSVNSGQLMEPLLATSFDGPQHDEIRGVQRQYGDPFEPDNTFAEANDIGTINVGPQVTIGDVPAPAVTNGSLLSIDANGELDWFRFSVTRPTIMTIRVDPIGQTYDDSNQAGDGSCPATASNIDSLTTADLNVDLIASNGTTVIATANTALAGASEILTTVLVPTSAAGTFNFVRVGETGAPAASQLYKLRLTAISQPTMTASDGTSASAVDLSWTAITNATSYTVLRNSVDNLATAAPIASGLTTTTYSDTTAVPGTTYFYYVQCAQGAGPLVLMAPVDSGFRDQPLTPPGPFIITSPTSGEINVSLTPTITWTTSSGADSYSVTIDDNADFASPVLSQSGITATSLAVSAGVLAPCTDYFLRVRAVNAAGDYANIRGFRSFSPADFNNDGFVDFFDFDDFTACFESGNCPPGRSPDFNNDSFVDFFDFDDYVLAFGNGC